MCAIYCFIVSPVKETNRTNDAKYSNFRIFFFFFWKFKSETWM